MAEQQHHAPGGHYSGANPIPTISQFIANLDKDKKSRDKHLDERASARAAGTHSTSHANRSRQQGDSHPHEVQHGGVEGTRKVVTDPTTGDEVVIEDVHKVSKFNNYACDLTELTVQDTIQNAIDPQVNTQLFETQGSRLTVLVCGTQCESWQTYRKLQCHVRTMKLAGKLTTDSLFKPIPHNHTLNIRRTRTLHLLQTQSRKAQHQMCQYMEKRPTSSSILRLP